MTFHHVAGSPVFTPNKIPFIINFQSKWSAEALEGLKSLTVSEIRNKDEFDKLDNPLLNGLKKFSRNDLVVCKKCEEPVKVSLNGAVKSTFQFDCKKGSHHVSATQILGTLPDEWVTSTIELMCESTRLQTLKWIDKEHLASDIWEIKGLKNATKRFASELSPIKTNDTKTRAVNLSLEAEVKELKLLVENLMKRQDAIESENGGLRTALKAAREEAAMLRRLLSEESPKTSSMPESNSRSFAEVTNIFRPKVEKKQVRNLTPLETISKSASNINTSSNRPTYSPLKIVFFEGCHRKSPVLYRKMFKDLGIDGRTIRDVTFLTEDLMQLTTYESAVEGITAALQGINPNVHRVDSFDPTKAESYSKYGSFKDEEVKASYFAMMTKSAERLTKAAGNVKALKRSANFLNKVVESQNIVYKPKELIPKVYFLGNLLNYTKPSTASNVEDPKVLEMEPEEMGGVEQSAPSSQ